MGRGKDGYTSLLVKSEGGECEEIVSEENGILVSLMMRQYFMSLRAVGQWANWGPSMSRHWGKVAAEVGTSHLLVAPTPSGTSPKTAPASESLAKRKRGWADFTPTKLRSRRSSLVPASQAADESSSDEEGDEAEASDMDDKELTIMRKVFRKWCRLAGVQARACDNLGADEVEVLWTKAVAPKIEGRIMMVDQTGA